MNSIQLYNSTPTSSMPHLMFAPDSELLTSAATSVEFGQSGFRAPMDLLWIGRFANYFPTDLATTPAYLGLGAVFAAIDTPCHTNSIERIGLVGQQLYKDVRNIGYYHTAAVCLTGNLPVCGALVAGNYAVNRAEEWLSNHVKHEKNADGTNTISFV